MRRILAAVFLLSGLALAQGVRFGDQAAVETLVQDPNLRTSTGVTPKFVTATGPATISFCIAPANGVPCTNKATTYTDSTLLTACSTGQQLTIADSNSCVGQTDVNGHWGVWANPGQYEYTITISGASSGPFPATLGGSGGGGGGGGTVTAVTGTASQIDVANSLTTPVLSISNPFIFPGNATFNRLISSSSNAPTTGGSILFGPTDPIIYGCTTCAVSPLTGLATSQNLIRGSGSTGPVKVGDYQGISIFSEQIKGATSGIVTIQTQAVAGTWALTLPTSAGSAGQCLTTDGAGVSSWAACAGGGGGNVTTAPGAGVNQNIIQPINTSFSANVIANHRYAVASYNWLQTDVAGSIGNLAAAGAGKVLTLTPCPLGFDPTIATQFPYAIYISGVGTPEVAILTAGTGTAGGASCTATVTTVNVHAAGFSVGSANDGVQEAWNDGSPQVSTNQNHPDVILASNTIYNIHYPPILHGRGGALWGYGAQFYCFTRGSCLIIGSAQLGSIGTYQRVFGLSLTSKNNVAGAQITNVQDAAGTYTITTNTNHNLVPGDKADVWIWSAQTPGTHAVIMVATTADTTHFTFVLGASTFGSTPAWGTAVLGNFAIENNSNGVILRDINTFNVSGNDYFSYAIVNDNDQAMTIDGYKNRASGSIRCDANFCGYHIYQRGDQGNSGIIFLENSELSMQCFGNGILYGTGNGAGVKDTIIQGFAQTAIYAVNGLQGTKLDQVYEEVGSCNNPYYPTPLFSAAGLIATGHRTEVEGPLPIIGQLPQFANTGTNNRNYFIVPHSSTNGVGPTLLAGFAKTNGAGNVVVVWPQLPGNAASTITYDLLLTTCDRGALCASPTYAVGGATSLTTASTGVTCALGFCQFTDTHAAGSAYTLATQQYAPQIPWWPGGIVLTNSGDVGSAASVASLYALSIPSTTVSGINSAAGALVPTVFLEKCPSFSAWSPVWIVCPGADASGTGIFSTVFNQADGANNGPASNATGRLSLGPLTGTAPFHLIELMDRNFPQTMTQPGMRGTASSLNTYIGTDANDQLSVGSRTAISFYLANLGDNTNWLERLTTSAKTFKVPVTITNGTTSGYVGLTQGTANATTANSVGLAAPAAVTAYNYVFPGSGTDGLLTGNLSGSTVTASFSGDSNHSIHLTGQTASLGATTVCPATAGGCNVAGMYKISGYLVSTVSCGTPGPGAIAPLLTWNDGTSLKSAVAIPVSTDASQTASAGSVALGSVGTHWGWFNANVWSAGAAALQVSTTYTACTAGTGTYEIDATVIQLQ